MTVAGTGGRFAFRQLQPGNYRVSAIVSTAGASLQSQAVEVKLDASGVTGLNLGSLLVAVIGAVILLLVVRAVRKRS